MQFDFRLYQRKFRQPLRTNHGLWSVREGIIVRLIDETGQIGYGEIAPIEAFGTESIEQAIEFCHRLPKEMDEGAIAEIPDTLPSCQFGFESALRELSLRFQRIKSPRMEDFKSSYELQSSLRAVGRIRCGESLSCPHPLTPSPILGEGELDFLLPSPKLGRGVGGEGKFHRALTHSVLLPSGEAVFQTWQNFWEQGYRTFKLKISVNSIQEELKTVKRLLAEMPNQAILRLDANGGLNEVETQQWLEFCDDLNIEFLEQPLPVTAFDTMLELADRYRTPIALDESVTTISQLKDCHDRGWREIFVIKPAIAGFPSQLYQFCKTHAIDTVFSSVFETAIAREAGLNLAAELSNRAVGYGTTHWFTELMMDDFDALWNSL